MILNYNHRRSIGGKTLLSDLVSYWKFDLTIPQVTQSYLLEDSHSNYDGYTLETRFTLPGTATGKINNSLTFGPSQYFYPAYVPMSTLSGDFSISLWMKITNSFNSGAIFATDSNSTTRIIIRASGTNVQDWTVYVRDSSGIEYNGTVNGIGSSSVFSHYVFVVRSGISLEIYKNGVLVNTLAIGLMGNLGSNTYLAGAQGDYNPITSSVFGLYDEVAVWNRSLDNYDISKLYLGGNPIQYPWNL